MLNMAFVVFCLLALTQRTAQSPVQDGLKIVDKFEAGAVLESAIPLIRSVPDKSPITALTTVTTLQSVYYNTDILERDIYTTYQHSLPPPTGTRTRTLPGSTPSPTTSTSTAVPTKSLKNCNVEGIPTDYLVSNILDMRYAYDALACQLKCMYISRCEAYSWQTPVSTDSNNCVFYSTLIDGARKVTPSNISGIFFSDKYPSDRSNFCYGNQAL